MQVRIVPSILSADLTRLGEQVREADLGGADRIQIDVMDGRFVPNITFGPKIVEAVRRSALEMFLEAHLMIVEPERHIESFAEAGADMIIVHAEATVHLHRAIQLMKQAGVKAGVALNPATPLVSVEEVIPDIDLLLLMTVNPGWGGQDFIRSSVSRIQRARRMIDTHNPRCNLEVDGGIYGDPDHNTALDAVRAGADTLVAGSAVYKHPGGVAAGIKALREAVSFVGMI
ncbi:MAG: ribulose-phosphate 3-epimerase [Anaerolineae bacterium]|nr:ribulose-phosphate 3-epimerase [Anaerolineae bacterium]